MDDRIKKSLVWGVVIVAVAAGLFFGLRGCTIMPWNKEAATGGMVSISITQDFGQRVVKTGQVKPSKGATAMDLLKGIANVKTEYGGGFVSAIDGLASTSGQGARKDWFYYVNGILSGEGSCQLEVRSGDRIWWDLHDWSAGNFMSAVVGSYPQPFSRGISKSPHKTTIAYSTGLEGLARETGEHLSAGGARVAYAVNAAGFTKSKLGPSMVFLTLEQAARTPWVTEALGAPGKRGTLLSLEGGKLTTLDASGNPAPLDGGARAAVVALGTGMGDACPVWLAICDGEAGAEQARRLLVKEPADLALKVGAAVDSGGQIYSLPR